MANNFRGLLFVLLFLCLANVLFSQEANDTGSKHRISWTRDDYALRYEVVIEKEENKRHSLVLREFTEEPFIFISLPPGNYRLRVIPYDFRDIPGRGTGWKNFKVLAITTPDSGSDSEVKSQLVMEDPSPSISVQEEVKAPQQEEDKTPVENIAEDPTRDTDLTKPGQHKDIFVGLFAEALGYSRYNIAAGGGIVFGFNMNGIGFGIHYTYVRDEENFNFLEGLYIFRLYLSQKKDNTGLFLQAEGGVVWFWYDDDISNIINCMSFVGGLSAGWRFMMNKQWYIEPFIRGGYPYIFGAGFSTGFKFDF